MPLSSCPVCGGGNLMAAVSTAALSREVWQRNQYVAAWLHRKPEPAEAKDLSDFMHGGPARLLRCGACGFTVRDESEVRATGSYEEDPNDPDLMQHVLPRYVEAFRNKAGAYRDRLAPRASVVELGSHLGGFLQVAEEWNWRVTGLDIGRDTAEFAKRRGLTVRREIIEDTRLPARSADAVFVWNCFEQLADPASMLAAAWKLLGRHGLLVLRVPNAAFYFEADADALAWNNLLGFPYLYGHTQDTLTRLVLQHGFEPVRGYNSELVTMPIADLSSAVRAEQIGVSERVSRWSTRSTAERGILTGPWIELIFRKRDEVQRRHPRLSCQFLERGA